jgi:hypothetical protein
MNETNHHKMPCFKSQIQIFSDHRPSNDLQNMPAMQRQKEKYKQKDDSI